MLHNSKRHGWPRRAALAALMGALCLGLGACRPLVTPPEKTLSIYASFYPIYALADAVAADVPNEALHCLVQPQDGCLRRYQLSDWDAYLLAYSADAVLMGGRGLEAFESQLFSLSDGPAVSAVLYNLPLYSAQQDSHTDEESHLSGANPHLYMSISGAKEIVESISASMQSLDPAYAEKYAANAVSAAQRLDDLLAECREIAGETAGRRAVLMNEALIYPAQDYDLDVVDWIDRESGTSYYDDELADCLNRLAEAEPDVVLIERQAPSALVEALEAAGFSVARIDILSTHAEPDGFETYIQAQRDNAHAIRDALRAGGHS